MACSVEEIHQYDVGTIFQITLEECDVIVDISSATIKEIIFKKVSGITITKTAIFVIDGTDGRISYTTIADDLDEIGTWEIQAKVVLPTGTWHSSKSKFKVWSNL